MLDFLFYHLFLALGVVLTLFFIAQVLREPRPPAASLAWLLFIVALPYVAIPLYLAIGGRKLRVPGKAALYEARSSGGLDPAAHPLDRLLDSYGIPPATCGNRVAFHATGEEALEGLWRVIDHARERLDLCIFIFADDEVGASLCERLERKAREGTRVRLLLDGVGSFLLPRRRVRRLQEQGIRVRWFIPVLHPPFRGRTNLRNHRKMVIADGRLAWSGGRNLAREYFDSEGRHGTPWIDLSYELEGEGVAAFQELFEADWAFAGGATPSRRTTPAPVSGRARTRLLPSGPDMPEDPLQALLVAACFDAREEITAVTPYFVPDEALLEALCLAARRGVEVKLLLPQRSNHLLPDVARRRYLRRLVESGGRVRLQPGVMNHAKAIVVDRRLALCGSANLDLRSLYLNYEVMSIFYDSEQAGWLAEWIGKQSVGARPFPVEPPGPLGSLVEGMVVMLSFQL